MSLLRVGQRASKFTALNLTRFSRKSSTEATSTPEKQLEEKTKLRSGEVAIQPVRDVMVADVISGAPGTFYTLWYTGTQALGTQCISAELRHRPVRIYQPTRNTMQSGSGKSERWRIDWDILEGGGRWENPLMGYASS